MMPKPEDKKLDEFYIHIHRDDPCVDRSDNCNFLLRNYYDAPQQKEGCVLLVFDNKWYVLNELGTPKF